MVTRLLDAASAAEFRASIAQLQRDFADFIYTGPFQFWTVNRPAGWEDGVGIETQGRIGAGTGKLYEQGAGGPQTGEQVIHIESPYRFRTEASHAIETGHMLVLDTGRRFRVDLPKREGDDDLLMNVYLTELFNTPMPGTG